MTDTQQNDHVWFAEHIAAALAGGLDAAERVRFDAHARQCESCAAELKANEEMERHMSGLFALPAAGLEDRIIDALRTSRDRWRLRVHVHPAVRRAVTGVAAAIVIAAVGYAVEGQLEEMPSRVRTASNLRQLGESISLNSNDNRGTYPRTAGERREVRFADDYSRVKEHAAEADAKTPASNTSTLWFEDGHALKLEGSNVFAGKSSVGRDVSGIGAGDRAYKQLQANKPTYGVTNGGTLYWDKDAQTKSGAGTITLNSDAENGRQKTNWGEVLDGNFSTLTPTITAGDSDGDGVAGAKGTSDHDYFFRPTQLGTGHSGVISGGTIALGGQKLSEVEHGTKAPAGGQAERPVEVLRAGVEVHELGDAITPAPVALAAAPVQTPPPAAAEVRAHEQDTRKIIRNGQIEFEVDRYDAAFAQVSKLTTEAGGYVGTTDSEKLPNGKVKGAITLRVPPDRLDTLVLQLRGIGDLKSQKLDANDITKQYTDLESELRAARAMEERLLAIIKEGKGQIKDLLAAEKELGIWRTKIEKIVGEMRYFDNQVAMSTLIVSLFERDIKTPAAAQQTETIDAGMEAADVEKARIDALKAIEDAKGRVIQSDLKRYDAGQFGATIVAEIPPDNAGPLLDRLKQIGKVARLDIQRKQTTDPNADSSAPLRVDKKPSRLNLSMYNLANVAPRVSTTLGLAADDVEKTYRAIIERVNKSGGRVVGSNLAKNKPEQTSGTIGFEVPSAEADAVVNDLRAMGELMKLSVTENPDVNNVTTAKRGFALTLFATASVPARETTTLQIAATKVGEAREKILSAAGSGGARVLMSQLNENDRNNPNAGLELEVPRASLAAVEKVLGEVGDIVNREVVRSSDTENTLDTKVKLRVALISADRLPARESTAMTVETSDVDGAMANLQIAVSQNGGRIVESNLSKERDGATIGKLSFEVPLANAASLIAESKKQGTIRGVQLSQNLQVPAGSLAKARVDLQIVTPDTIVEAGSGPIAMIRNGLATSVKGLLWSLQLIVIGVCWILPFALVLWVGWKFIKRTPKLRRDVGAGAT